MELVDAVNLSIGAGSGWQRGGKEFVRECGVKLSLLDACDDELETIILDGDGPETYDTRLFEVYATLDQSWGCKQDDDVEWLRGALRQYLNVVLGQVLVSAPLGGLDEGGFWTGAIGVGIVSFSGDTETDGPALARTINTARTQWYNTVLTDKPNRPVLHLSPRLAPILLTAGLVNGAGGDAQTIWGDPIVMSPGYEVNGPNAFWSGEMNLTLSEVESEGIAHSRSNREVVTADFIGVLGVAPCTVVRVDFS